MEDPFWKLRCVYLLKDPRARLAEIKRSAQFVDTAGTLRYTPCTSNRETSLESGKKLRMRTQLKVWKYGFIKKDQFKLHLRMTNNTITSLL